MKNWNKHTLAAIAVTMAGFVYINSSHMNAPAIPLDLRDAPDAGRATEQLRLRAGGDNTPQAPSAPEGNDSTSFSDVAFGPTTLRLAPDLSEKEKDALMKVLARLEGV